MKTALVTGGCGFIGHHLVEHIFKTTDWHIVIIDKLTYASKGLDRLRDLDILNHPRVRFFCFDLSQPITDGLKRELAQTSIDYIIHLAAETHVDASIKDPELFVKNNLLSTLYILEYARQLPHLQRFFYFSTDEVYGPAPPAHSFKEWDPHRPTNPYSASKAGAEDLALSYQVTYQVPVIIVNVMNAMGERQHVEKFIPSTIRKVMKGEMVYVHAASSEEIGSRFYIHCRNIADAVLFLVANGQVGQKYNITGEREMDNLEMAEFIAETLGIQLKYQFVDPNQAGLRPEDGARPGHDMRYALDGTKLYQMGWRPPVHFENSLKKTILWTASPEHEQWLDD